jgi:glutathione S-transferase
MAMELGLDYDNVPIGFADGTNKSPDYRAVNPNGRVPAIDDDGFVLRESLAINLYLAKKHAAGRFYPATLQGEARAWQWRLWATTEVEEPMIAGMFNALVLPPEKRDAAAAAEGKVQLDRLLSLLDGALASQLDLFGADFTVADRNLAAVSHRAPRHGSSAASSARRRVRR